MAAIFLVFMNIHENMCIKHFGCAILDPVLFLEVIYHM